MAQNNLEWINSLRFQNLWFRWFKWLFLWFYNVSTHFVLFLYVCVAYEVVVRSLHCFTLFLDSKLGKLLDCLHHSYGIVVVEVAGQTLCGACTLVEG